MVRYQMTIKEDRARDNEEGGTLAQGTAAKETNGLGKRMRKGVWVRDGYPAK